MSFCYSGIDRGLATILILIIRLLFLYWHSGLFTYLIIQVMLKASHLEWSLQKGQQPQHCQTPHGGKPRHPVFTQEDADSHSDIRVCAPILNAGKARRAMFAMIRVLRPAIKEHGSVANRWRQRTWHVGVLMDPLTLRNHASIRLS